LTGDRDDVAAELQGERFRHDRHPSSEEQILTGQESTEPGAVPSSCGTHSTSCSIPTGARATSRGPGGTDPRLPSALLCGPRRRRTPSKRRLRSCLTTGAASTRVAGWPSRWRLRSSPLG
ncbi:hypothetical protein FHG89_28220, partial [Micromonospora orduensis]